MVFSKWILGGHWLVIFKFKGNDPCCEFYEIQYT